MKPYHAIIVFLLLVCSAAISSVHGYRATEQSIIEDMNQALAQTLQAKQDYWITPDTIKDYRSHLKLKELRDRSYVYYAMDDNIHGLRSNKMRWQRDDASITFQGYAGCSAASVLLMSDQTLPVSLSLLSFLWMAFAIVYFKRHREAAVVLGRMTYQEADQCFYDLNHQVVRLTPMQLELMRMFCHAEHHTLSKQEICDALWPKKPDASETLYTLIKRLKPIVETQGHLKIVSDRGKAYRLEEQ